MIVAGGLRHLLVVSLPLLCLGHLGASFADPAVLIFLTGASAPYAGDAVTIKGFDSVLVRSGVYRFLRHPSETGLLAASLGAAVLLQSLLGLVVWFGALLPVTLARLALEERALELRFGTFYERYAEEVGGLVPLSPGR